MGVVEGAAEVRRGHAAGAAEACGQLQAGRRHGPAAAVGHPLCVLERVHGARGVGGPVVDLPQLDRLVCRWQMSGVRCQVAGGMCQVSSVRCQVSGVKCQVSGVRCQVSSVRCQVAGGGVSLARFVTVRDDRPHDAPLAVSNTTPPSAGGRNSIRLTFSSIGRLFRKSNACEIIAHPVSVNGADVQNPGTDVPARAIGTENMASKRLLWFSAVRGGENVP